MPDTLITSLPAEPAFGSNRSVGPECGAQFGFPPPRE